MAGRREGGVAGWREGAWAGWHIGGMVLIASLVAVACARTLLVPPSRHPAFPPASAVRDADITFYEARVARDPYGATDRARLAALYLERARTSTSEADFARAAALADASLALRQERNETALLTLVGAHLGRHHFAEALDAARQLEALDSLRPRVHAVVGEVLLELGRYHEADAEFERVGEMAADPSTLARLARWHEIRGRLGDARRLALRAAKAASHAYGVSDEVRTWFELRAADLASRYGQAHSAEDAIGRALQLAPADHRALSAAARLALQEQEWDLAAEYAGRALAVSSDPTALALLARAERRRGHAEEAERALRAMEAALSGQGSWHRDWGLVLLEEHRRVPEVLARTEAELQRRRDVYTLDLYAWALFRNGRRAEALVAVDEALAVGTRDPELLRHARLIREHAP